MRITSDFLVLIPKAWDEQTLINFFTVMFSYMSKSDEAHTYINLRATNIPVRLRGVKRLIAVPPLAAFIRRSDWSCLSNLDHLSMSYEVSEDVWVECKELPRSINVFGDGFLRELLSKLHLDVNVCEDVGVCGKSANCLVISCTGCMEGNEYEGVFLSLRHLIDMNSIKGLSISEVDGYMRFYQRDHPLLYGLNFSKFRGELIDVSKLRRLALISKPLVFINSNPLVLEIPYNSLAFLTSFKNLSSLILRAIIYVC